jgi:hypothetical protein
MKNIIKGILLLLMLSSMQAEAQIDYPKIKLEKGEKKFKSLKQYRLKDFHLTKDIAYIDMVKYGVSEKMKIEHEGKFRYIMKMGMIPSKKNSTKSFIWLSKALLKQNYFWKETHPLIEDHTFTSLRYLKKSDNRFNAVETLQDIKDLLGNIDTVAELHLWLYASEYEPYSYKKIGKLYRVRFRTPAMALTLGCYYEERFQYYNSNGDRVKNKKIKSFTVKNCSEIMI